MYRVHVILNTVKHSTTTAYEIKLFLCFNVDIAIFLDLYSLIFPLNGIRWWTLTQSLPLNLCNYFCKRSNVYEFRMQDSKTLSKWYWLWMDRIRIIFMIFIVIVHYASPTFLIEVYYHCYFIVIYNLILLQLFKQRLWSEHYLFNIDFKSINDVTNKTVLRHIIT